MSNNMLAVLPVLKARLAAVPNVVAVESIQELAQLMDDRAITPLDSAVYVGLDGFAPLSSSVGNKRMKKKRLSFSVILAKQFYGAEDVPHDDEAVGELLTSLCSTLQGWTPRDEEDKPMVVEPFDEVEPLSPLYYDNFALYPLRFETVILSKYSGD